jgi:hypothetical protein
MKKGKKEESEMKTKLHNGTVAVVVWAYNSGSNERGDIVSQHRTMSAAQNKARRSSFWAVRDVRDME